MGEAAEETGKREEADLCDAAPLLAQRVLKRLPKTDDRVFPAFEPKVYVIRKLVLAGGPDGDFHRWRHTIATWLQGQGYSEGDCGVVAQSRARKGPRSKIPKAGPLPGWTERLRCRAVKSKAGHPQLRPTLRPGSRERIEDLCPSVCRD